MEEPRLPPGYRLDRSDPDVWALARRLGGSPLQCPGCHQEGYREDGVGRLRRRRRGAVSVKKTHDQIYHYRGYWSEGGKCKIRIYRE
jgi:hypothetical protein